MISRNLLELQVGDVIIDLQGKRHTVTEPVEGPFPNDEDGDPTWRICTDTYPRGGILNGREITPNDGRPESILFAVEVPDA